MVYLSNPLRPVLLFGPKWAILWTGLCPIFYQGIVAKETLTSFPAFIELFEHLAK